MHSNLHERGQAHAAPVAVAANADNSGSRATGPSSLTTTPSTSSKQGSSSRYQKASNNSFLFFASVAGVFGAASGVVGKMAVTTEAVSALLQRVSPGLFASSDAAAASADHASSALPVLSAVGLALLAVRLSLLALNALCTAQMWRFYLRALAAGPTPVCQIVSTGTNFAASAVAGLLLFGESVSVLWAAGALLVVIGLGLIVSDPRLAPHTD